MFACVLLLYMSLRRYDGCYLLVVLTLSEELFGLGKEAIIATGGTWLQWNVPSSVPH